MMDLFVAGLFEKANHALLHLCYWIKTPRNLCPLAQRAGSISPGYLKADQTTTLSALLGCPAILIATVADGCPINPIFH